MRAAGELAQRAVRQIARDLGAAPELRWDVERAAGDDDRHGDLTEAPCRVEVAGFELGLAVGEHDAVHVEGELARRAADYLDVISAKGSHSDELKRLFESKARLETVETDSVVGENTQFMNPTGNGFTAAYVFRR